MKLLKIIFINLVIFLNIVSISLADDRVNNATEMPEFLQCLDATKQMEAEYNIPPHILSAIALTESGRRDNHTKIRTPWPWTANIAGAGRYFNSRTEALLTFKRLIAQKNYMFDVGCMQINWHYHKEAFSSIEEALDPYYNVRYAAEFLTSLYAETGSWTQAAVYYHSKTPIHYQRYRKIVASNWDNARDLMSPIDGYLSNIFTEKSALINSVKSKKAMIDYAKLERMREIARLRTKIRQYAQND